MIDDPKKAMTNDDDYDLDLEDDTGIVSEKGGQSEQSSDDIDESSHKTDNGHGSFNSTKRVDEE